MRRRTLLIVIALVLIILLTSGRVMARGGGKSKNTVDSMAPYALSTVKTVQGTIRSVDVVYNRHTNEDGIHLRLMTSRGEYIIHVCPEWYAEQQNIRFSKGESISVTGSEFNKDNEKNIYAATIERTAEPALLLRDKKSGKELWDRRHEGSSEAKEADKGQQKRQKHRPK